MPAMRHKIRTDMNTAVSMPSLVILRNFHCHSGSPVERNRFSTAVKMTMGTTGFMDFQIIERGIRLIR